MVFLQKGLHFLHGSPGIQEVGPWARARSAPPLSVTDRIKK